MSVRKYKGFFVLAGWWIITSYGAPASAQETSSICCSFDGNIRYRFEKWHNMNARGYGNRPALGNSDDKILLQRIIAGTTIRAGNRITVSAHLQDSRAFGWSLKNSQEPDAFKIHGESEPEPF